MTDHRGIRLTERRFLELKEDIARLEARMTAIEERPDGAMRLAEELGTAALRTLQPRRRPTPPQPKGL